MKWENKKCTIVCSSTDKINKTELKLWISGGEIEKKTEGIYLAMSIKSDGITTNKNIARAQKSLTQTRPIATVARLGTSKPWDRTRLVCHKSHEYRY